jgi:capsular exopolysaccharide synthesis family protein
MEFWRHYGIFKRWRWIIVGSALIAIAIEVALYPVAKGEFVATTVLSVPSEQRSLFLISGLPAEQESARAAQAMNLVRSRDVAARVGKRLNLDMDPGELQHRVSVGKEQGSDFMYLSVRGRTAEEAVSLANTVAEIGAAYDLEVQTRAVGLAREFAERQLEEARARLQRADAALLGFRQTSAFDLSNPKSAQIASLQNLNQTTDLSLNEIDAKLALVRAQMGEQSATRTDKEFLDNPITQQLRGELVGLEISLASELALHTEKYPTVVALKAKTQAVKDRLNSELNKIVSRERVQFNPIYDALMTQRIALQTERVALQARREGLQKALGQTRQQLPGLDKMQLEQARLSQNVDILGKRYNDLEDRLAQLRLKEQELQDLGTLTVVNPARTAGPTAIKSPIGRLALAAILGILGGAGLAVLFDYLDNTFQTPERAERMLGLPILAAIPRHNPPFDEAYRLLRVNLAAYWGETDVLAVTGARPRQGTSTVVANLARAFARAGRHTIIVDAALERPTQHTRFGVANKRGLVDVLRGAITLEDAVVATTVPNLWVLPSGSVPPEGGAILCNGKMAEVMSALKQRGDVVVVDTVPAGTFADAFAVAPLVSGVLLVVDARSRQMPHGVEEQVKSQLEKLGVQVLGVVLTKVRPDLVESYVHQQRFYKEARGRKLHPAAAIANAMVVILIAGSLLVLGYWALGSLLPQNVQSVFVHTLENSLLLKGPAPALRLLGL